LAGRAAERQRLLELLAGARRGASGVVVVHREAGAGKSALLGELADDATDFTELAYGAFLRRARRRADARAALRAAFDRCSCPGAPSTSTCATSLRNSASPPAPSLSGSWPIGRPRSPSMPADNPARFAGSPSRLRAAL
jgi:hypothetical protein